MYKFLDHPSEAYIQVDAPTDEGIFEESATALFELMTDTSVLKSETTFSLELQDPDRSLLLIDWLNRLILLHEVENVFLKEFRVVITFYTNWKLEAEVTGEKIKSRHERRVHAKSATFGNLEWLETPDGHTVRFVIDI